jgi:hypothetical protein
MNITEIKEKILEIRANPPTIFVQNWKFVNGKVIQYKSAEYKPAIVLVEDEFDPFSQENPSGKKVTYNKDGTPRKANPPDTPEKAANRSAAMKRYAAEQKAIKMLDPAYRAKMEAKANKKPFERSSRKGVVDVYSMLTHKFEVIAIETYLNHPDVYFSSRTSKYKEMKNKRI